MTLIGAVFLNVGGTYGRNRAVLRGGWQRDCKKTDYCKTKGYLMHPFLR